jgi:alcohol dehydrogenase
MAKMRSMVVRERGGRFVAEERDIPIPGPQEMRIRVQACGVCHSDVVTVQGLFPIVQYPRVPGHEVIGVVDALGEGVHGWKVGAWAGLAARAVIVANADATMRLSARMCTKSAA